MSVDDGNWTTPKMDSNKECVWKISHSKLECNSQLFFMRYLYKVFNMN
jgi:hypothetical protein